MNVFLVALNFVRLPDQLILPEMLASTQTLPPLPLCLRFFTIRARLSNDNDIVLARVSVLVVLAPREQSRSPDDDAEPAGGLR